jgi:hypothetical protein
MGVRPSNDTRENLIKSLLKMKAHMSSVRGTIETGTPVTVSIVLPRTGDVFLLAGSGPELVITVAPNWKNCRMRGFVRMKRHESYSNKTNPGEEFLGAYVASG